VVYRVTVACGPCRVRAEDRAFPSARITTDAATWLSLDAGELSSMPRAELMVLPDVGHVPQFEAPRRPAGW
jgi:hypothetical protein